MNESKAELASLQALGSLIDPAGLAAAKALQSSEEAEYLRELARNREVLAELAFSPAQPPAQAPRRCALSLRALATPLPAGLAALAATGSLPWKREGTRAVHHPCKSQRRDFLNRNSATLPRRRASRNLMRSAFCLVMLVSLPAPAQQQSGSANNPQYDPANINYGFGGILPRDVPYKPMTGEQRWRMFVNDEFKNPGAYARAIGAAAIDQRRDSPGEWGQTAGGYTQRVGSRFGKFAIASAIEHSSAAALGHDPRYIRCRCDGFFRRAGHALGYTFVSYNRGGNRVFYFSRIAGAFGGEALSSSWTPGQKWYVEGYQGAFQQITIGSLFNVLREFGPEIKRALKRK